MSGESPLTELSEGPSGSFKERRAPALEIVQTFHQCRKDVLYREIFTYEQTMCCSYGFRILFCVEFMAASSFGFAWFYLHPYMAAFGMVRVLCSSFTSIQFLQILATHCKIPTKVFTLSRSCVQTLIPFHVVS